jgi:hypothetical protein
MIGIDTPYADMNGSPSFDINENYGINRYRQPKANVKARIIRKKKIAKVSKIRNRK